MSDDVQLHGLLCDEKSKSYQVTAAIRDAKDAGAKLFGLVLGSSFTSGIVTVLFVGIENRSYFQSFLVILLVFSLGWATLASIKLAAQPALSSALFCNSALNDNDWSEILIKILKKTEADVRSLQIALVITIGVTSNIVLFSPALLLESCNSEFARATQLGTFVCSGPNAYNEK